MASRKETLPVNNYNSWTNKYSNLDLFHDQAYKDRDLDNDEEIQLDSLTLDELYVEYNTSYFPPALRERVRKKLESAGKFHNTLLSPLEVTQVKFEYEAHVLNKTVIVDDGTERKVYSSCVFENVKRYDCRVCVTAVFGKTALINHNSGRKHYYNLKKTTHPHENFDENQIVDIDPCVFLSDADIITEVIDRCTAEVLIGLEYLVEVDFPRNPYLHCLLCDVVSDDVAHVMEHLQSIEHRMFYLLLFFPKVYKKLLLLRRDIRMVQLCNVVREIEKKLGRLKPWRHVLTLSLKQKRAIRYSIDSGPHLRDDVNLSFAEDIPFNERLKNEKIYNTVITEFVTNESEDCNMDTYVRLKGGVYRCMLCKINVDSPIEKITHPYTGRHLEKTVKGSAIYDSVSCQIQSVFDNFIQPLIGTEYIVEYDEQGVFLYYCMLCRKSMNNPDMVTSHLVSKSHRQRYISHHMPKKDLELRKLSGPVRAEEFERLLKLIEAKLGRLRPYGCLFSLDHQVDSKITVKDLVSTKIMDGIHFTVDERGVPRVIYKMPLPLFPPKENQVLEMASETKRKSRKRSRRSESPSSSQATKRRRSPSSSSSESLSPAARLRGLSPEPGPSRVLPEEPVMPPVAVISDWLEKVPTPTSRGPAPKMCTSEMITEFFEKCDEDNWKTRRNDKNHDCCPLLRLFLPLQKALKDEYKYYSLRKSIINKFLKRKLVRERGWTLNDLNKADESLKTMFKIMQLGPVCAEVCRPLCENLVESILETLYKEWEEVKTLTEEDVYLCALGLVHVSNWMYFMWSFISEWEQSDVSNNQRRW